jgi:hypothetical protein
MIFKIYLLTRPANATRTGLLAPSKKREKRVASYDQIHPPPTIFLLANEDSGPRSVMPKRAQKETYLLESLGPSPKRSTPWTCFRLRQSCSEIRFIQAFLSVDRPEQKRLSYPPDRSRKWATEQRQLHALVEALGEGDVARFHYNADGNTSFFECANSLVCFG